MSALEFTGKLFVLQLKAFVPFAVTATALLIIFFIDKN